MTPADLPPKSPARKAALAIALILAVAAIVIELLVLFERLPHAWGSIGGGCIIIAIAIGVIGGGSASGRRRP